MRKPPSPQQLVDTLPYMLCGTLPCMLCGTRSLTAATATATRLQWRSAPRGTSIVRRQRQVHHHPLAIHHLDLHPYPYTACGVSALGLVALKVRTRRGLGLVFGEAVVPLQMVDELAKAHQLPRCHSAKEEAAEAELTRWGLSGPCHIRMLCGTLPYMLT